MAFGAIRRTRGLGGVIVLALLTAACGSSGAAASTSAPAHAKLAVAVKPPTVAIAPADKATDVTPDTMVTVKATGGQLTSVTVTEKDNGQLIPGDFTLNGTAWTANTTLIPEQTYEVDAEAASPDGGTASQVTSFQTLGGTHLITEMLPGDGAVVGVGMPIKLTFNTPIAASEQADLVNHLQVSTSPTTIVGAWHWFSPTEVHFRPENMWPSGTHVTLTANLLGINAGNGVWGYGNWSQSFTIGDKHVSIIDHNTEMMQVYDNDQLIRTVPVSLGKAGFPTLSGTLVVWYKSQKVMMDSCASGIDCRPGTANYYKEYVYWDTAISTDGFFIHDAYWDIPAQGHYDFSHGCVNVSPDNAIWFFNWAQVGDVVIIQNTARVADGGDGEGDWQIPFAQYQNSGTVS